MINHSKQILTTTLTPRAYEFRAEIHHDFELQIFGQWKLDTQADTYNVVTSKAYMINAIDGETPTISIEFCDNEYYLVIDNAKGLCSIDQMPVIEDHNTIKKLLYLKENQVGFKIIKL